MMHKLIEVARTANMFGALSSAMVDELDGRLRATSGYGGSASASLITLRERGALTVEQLRRIVGLTHSATVRLIDRLEGDGLVRRARGPDGRSVSVRLTRRGGQVALRLRGEREAALASVLGALTAREQAQLTRLAERLLASLTSSRAQARLICRSCDHGVCQGGGFCPVDRAATDLGQ
jgi:DNA-binding MarR family transcriptional regulator